MQLFFLGNGAGDGQLSRGRAVDMLGILGHRSRLCESHELVGLQFARSWFSVTSAFLLDTVNLYSSSSRKLMSFESCFRLVKVRTTSGASRDTQCCEKGLFLFFFLYEKQSYDCQGHLAGPRLEGIPKSRLGILRRFRLKKLG